MHCDLGTSITSRRPVTDEIRIRFPATIELALARDDLRRLVRHPARLPRREALRRRPSTTAASSASLIGISIPIFFLGLILKYIFAVRLGWLPSIGREDVLTRRCKHPTDFYMLDAIIDRQPGARSGTRSST